MIIGPVTRLLGHVINTGHLTLDTPPDFLEPLVTSLTSQWGAHWKHFTILEAKTLAGHLSHVSFTLPWLKHLIPHVYQSLSFTLQLNRAHLISTSCAFCDAHKISNMHLPSRLLRHLVFPVFIMPAPQSRYTIATSSITSTSLSVPNSHLFVKHSRTPPFQRHVPSAILLTVHHWEWYSVIPA